MVDSFRARFLREAGERPYAWAASLGLPKTLVTAVLRGGDDYRPIRRTLSKLAAASGKSIDWWLEGRESTPGDDADQSISAKEADYTLGSVRGVASIAAGARADPELLALAVRALEEWAVENQLEIDPERKGAIIAVLYDYIAKGAGDREVEGLLRIVN